MPNFVFIGSEILAALAFGVSLGWVIFCCVGFRQAASDRESMNGEQVGYRKARRRLWFASATLAIIVGVSAYWFFAFFLPWDRAQTVAARVEFVNETFVKRGLYPSQIILEPSDAERDGESGLYVGVAIIKAETWDVRVWNGNHELRMEANKR